MDAGDIATQLTEVLAEITRQTTAGAQFGTGLGQNRTGADFELLTSQRDALRWAQKNQAGNLPTESIADCSQNSI